MLPFAATIEAAVTAAVAVPFAATIIEAASAVVEAALLAFVVATASCYCGWHRLCCCCCLLLSLSHIVSTIRFAAADSVALALPLPSVSAAIAADIAAADAVKVLIWPIAIALCCHHWCCRHCCCCPLPLPLLPPSSKQPPPSLRQTRLLSLLLPPLAIAVAVSFAAAVVYCCRSHPLFLPSGLLPLILRLGITCVVTRHCHCCSGSHLYHRPSLTCLLWLNLQLSPLYHPIKHNHCLYAFLAEFS